MTISWIVFLVFIAIFAYRGYRHGIWAASARIISLILAYVVALLFTLQLAPIIEDNTIIQGVAALVSAGMLLFFTTSFLLSLLFFLLGKMMGAEKPSPLSARLGAAMGAVIGSVIGLAAVFFISYLIEVLPKNRLPNSVQNHQTNGIERLARFAASKLVTWVSDFGELDSSTAKISAALVREPGVMVKHIQNLQQNRDVKALFSDESNRATLQTGNLESIQSLPAFKNLVNNPDVQSLMTVSGLDDEGNGEAALAEQMSTVWQRAELLKNDQRIQEILRDPEFQQQLKSGNPMVLLNNAEFMEIASKLLVGSEGAENGFANTQGNQSSSTASPDTVPNLNPKPKPKPKEEPTIYRWVDDDGNIHYSDSPSRPPTQ